MAITILTTCSSSLTMMAICSMIPADLSRVAMRNCGLCKTLFDESPEQSDWHLESMRYGMDFVNIHDCDY